VILLAPGWLLIVPKIIDADDHGPPAIFANPKLPRGASEARITVRTRDGPCTLRTQLGYGGRSRREQRGGEGDGGPRREQHGGEANGGCDAHSRRLCSLWLSLKTTTQPDPGASQDIERLGKYRSAVGSIEGPAPGGRDRCTTPDFPRQFGSACEPRHGSVRPGRRPDRARQMATAAIPEITEDRGACGTKSSAPMPLQLGNGTAEIHPSETLVRAVCGGRCWRTPGDRHGRPAAGREDGRLATQPSHSGLFSGIPEPDIRMQAAVSPSHMPSAVHDEKCGLDRGGDGSSPGTLDRANNSSRASNVTNFD